jgi:hypothetical protein
MILTNRSETVRIALWRKTASFGHNPPMPKIFIAIKRVCFFRAEALFHFRALRAWLPPPPAREKQQALVDKRLALVYFDK